MAQASKIQVALIYGGRSGEHEVSVRSAHSVRTALNPAKYDVHDFFISKEGFWSPGPLLPQPGANPTVDVVFPVLHGTFGEDGTVQGLLELAELPYVGAGVLASAACMDKVVTKRLCKEAGLPVVDYVVMGRNQITSLPPSLPFPFPAFVKPANLGSSVGISKVKTLAELQRSVEEAAHYDNKIVIERGITGREFECAVLGGDHPAASVPCEIKPSQDFYTYEDKYLLDQAQIELPAQLTESQTLEMQTCAVRAFEAVGCEGMARVDFLMENATGQLFVNEINTIPGFTSISMFPKMWSFSGVPYSELLDRLIDLAFERARNRRLTQYSRL